MQLVLNPAARLANPLTWLLRRGNAQPARPQRTAEPADAVQALSRGRTLRVAQPLGTEIYCVQGSLWITHDGDPKDIVIEAGRSYVADRHAPLVVCALDSARLLVQPEATDAT
jgi:hypothetical protein